MHDEYQGKRADLRDRDKIPERVVAGCGTSRWLLLSRPWSRVKRVTVRSSAGNEFGADVAAGARANCPRSPAGARLRRASARGYAPSRRSSRPARRHDDSHGFGWIGLRANGRAHSTGRVTQAGVYGIRMLLRFQRLWVIAFSAVIPELIRIHFQRLHVSSASSEYPTAPRRLRGQRIERM